MLIAIVSWLLATSIVRFELDLPDMWAVPLHALILIGVLPWIADARRRCIFVLMQDANI